MNGKLVGAALVIPALLFGAFVYYQQVYAYYAPVPAGSPAAEIRLTAVATGQPEAVPVEGFEGIDADSSPLRFRACFRLPTSLATLTETYALAESAEPRIGPAWFSCFDANRIGTDIEAGTAITFIGQENIHPGIDRVVAVYPDGSAFAWHQPNPSLEN